MFEVVWKNLRDLFVWFWRGFKESRGFRVSGFWSIFKEPRDLFASNFWSSLKESWRPFYFVFEVAWKNLVKFSCLVFEVHSFKKSRGPLVSNFWSNLKGSRESFCFLFDVVWKNLGDPLSLVFEEFLKNLCNYLRLVFEVVWKALGIPCLVLKLYVIHITEPNRRTTISYWV